MYWSGRIYSLIKMPVRIHNSLYDFTLNHETEDAFVCNFDVLSQVLAWRYL